MKSLEGMSGPSHVYHRKKKEATSPKFVLDIFE
jgi:hypothetical protein